ncbi:creatininase family protein [Fimbriimonas ginsengisoli]|uniref:Creatininase n=1 Tax=Fimbriimonas ginsengisoli Gsoil 348 TaxID=661478 RepID=A0A068NIL5_FIMGI|nr:creatininase family protein [Fimbriimonas ginsengisoli]AIE83371.1 Creatininase [Fimbriimonas ginsengisoli Gsoil 348]
MKLAELTWMDVEVLSRDVVVLIPTGSLEQHGPHLPLFTDSLIATAVAQGVEQAIPEQVLLTPTLWLGASGHHLKFPGSLSADFDTYMGAIGSVVQSLLPHGFRRFYVLNGHGGNTSPNDMAMRKLKALYPEGTFAHSGYFAFCEQAIAHTLEGPLKGMRHACEAEASLMLHLHPNLVRKEKLRDDGLIAEPPVKGPVHHFDEITEQGSFGYATFASAEKGRTIFEAAVAGATEELRTIATGYVLRGLEPAQESTR